MMNREKKNNVYWVRRKEWRMYKYMEEAEKTAEEIKKAYDKAARYLSHEADRIFERFRKKHSLTEVEARRLINSLHDSTSLNALKTALKNAGGDDKAAILAELESPAYQYRLERLQQLQNGIDRMMKDVYHQERDVSTSFYADLANESYYRSIFDIQQQTGLGFSFAHLDSKVIDKLLKSTWSGVNYSRRIWNNTQTLAKDLKEELLVNLLTGRTEQETAAILANKFNQSVFNARRLVRTESCFVAEQMEMESYKECGVHQYIYLATLDLRTSDICRELDHKRFPVAKQQPGVNCPPMHPWCRSTTICDITSEELAHMRRRARNLVTGRNETVPGDMSYQQWYDIYVSAKPEAQTKERMLRNRVSDQKQYERYRQVLGDDVPESFEKFQEMKYNDTEKWTRMKKKAGVYSEIDKKEWSEDFKNKSRLAYQRFEKKGISLSAHALSRLPRLNKKGFSEIKEADVLALLDEKPNYKDGDGKMVYFSAKKQLAVVKNKNSGDIVSFVRRKKVKEGWEDV